ncbi:MAG: hypothetical protein H6706_12965 [Myxococcales bacterium]|nr:hypothetical protein [Myxococcales bacterium]
MGLWWILVVLPAPDAAVPPPAAPASVPAPESAAPASAAPSTEDDEVIRQLEFLESLELLEDLDLLMDE